MTIDPNRTPFSSPPSCILIEDVRPRIDCGRYPVKREVGDLVEVTADIFRDGHDMIAAAVQYRRSGETTWHETEMIHVDNDRWAGSFSVHENATYEYRIQAFPDVYGSWADEIAKKIDAGLDVSSELLEGQAIVLEVAARAPAAVAGNIRRHATNAFEAESQQESVDILLASQIADDIHVHRTRSGSTESPSSRIVVDRVRARYAAWYSMFPRSAGTIEGQSATFKDVESQLPRLQKMGFDILYFTPIHPIAMTNRKGRNNSLISEEGDPGVPYAIGTGEGGHDAIEPSLGTTEDFRELVEATARHGMEIALDIALQASPDHPWVTEHPEWFFIRPDGTIKYAENPPKKYQDIYPLNFNNANWKALWEEIERIILHWVSQGIKIFRVDNPHTKPTAFWEWLIAAVRSEHPDVIFLSEAFTRPKVMKSLAKAGFAQSYTYFTWRNFKQELIEYGTELTQSEMKEYFRGNFFTNTHDILPLALQEGGRPAFLSRVTLAATMSSSYGIYSGYELCEATPVPGREEYLNSEKYEYKVWDWDRPGNIIPFITRLNEIRREHLALQEYENLRFHPADDDNILCYGKSTDSGDDNVLVIVNLDPFEAHTSTVTIPQELLAGSDRRVQVENLLTGERYVWTGFTQTVSLDPAVNPVAILSLTR